MEYVPRIISEEIKAELNASGAVLIRGPKACGKTETAFEIKLGMGMISEAASNLKKLETTLDKNMLLHQSP